MQAVANDRETLDEICWRCLGRTHAVVELALSMNPGIASMGAQFPAGTVVSLPTTPITKPRQTIQLWD